MSGDCNLACTYCFYRRVPVEMYPDTPRHLMNEETLERLVRDYIGYGFSPAVMCWQGGEPTLAGLEFFKKVVTLQEKHGRRGQVIGNTLQTNGLLIDDDWSRFLAEYRFLVGLSIDGPSDIHDTQRVSGTGTGSFRYAMRAARRMARDGVAFNILVVVSRKNENRGRDVFQWLAAQGFGHVQFIPCVEPDGQGGVAEFSVTPEGYGKFLCEVFDEWMRFGPTRISVRDFESAVRFVVDGRHDVCTFQPHCGCYLLVEHNGDVYPCDFFAMEEWRLGNLTERPLAEFFDTEKMKQFARSKHAPLERCQSCEWREGCWGGCQKDRLVRGAMDRQHTYLCESYRMFFEFAQPGLKALAEMVRKNRETEAKRSRRDSRPSE